MIKKLFMINKLLMATAASGFVLSTALAQSQSPPPASPPVATPPAASQPQTPSKPSATAPAGQQVVTSQRPDQWLGSKFRGMDVVGVDDQKIGDVSDVLFDKQGKIEAYIVSIGGFLGVGSKDVALAPSAFEVVKGSEGSEDTLKVSMTQDQLKQMASFQPYQPPRATTTGTAPGGGPSRPTGGSIR